SIASAPAGASIYLDGNYTGVTPYVFEAEVGTHTLELKKNLYGTVSQEVIVSYEAPLLLEAKLHFNLLFSAAGVLLILFFMLFAKKHPEVLRVKIPTGSGRLNKSGKGAGRKEKGLGKLFRKYNLKKKFGAGAGSESGLESGAEFEYLVDLDKLPAPDFKYHRENQKGR
ncbi:MAG: PEGA domain-containing protein, partial [Methanosarcinaceae archaeon]|nr:PEGA domain-containing protein [Methanosarcinaceae archaeon]